jgi:hypothetical protein
MEMHIGTRLTSYVSVSASNHPAQQYLVYAARGVATFKASGPDITMRIFLLTPPLTRQPASCEHNSTHVLKCFPHTKEGIFLAVVTPLMRRPGLILYLRARLELVTRLRHEGGDAW